MRIQSFEMFESLSNKLNQEQVNWCNRHIDGEWKANSRSEIEAENIIEQVELVSNSDLFKRWLKSGISVKEFLHKNRGLITGKKFGI